MDYSQHQHQPMLSSNAPMNPLYSMTDSSMHYTTEPLQEPVPFEDFQFSFGLGPDFVIPVPFDIPSSEPVILTDEPSYGAAAPPQPPFPEAPPAPCNSLMMPTNNTVLNEDDRKTFSQFLDSFFMDQDTAQLGAEPLPNHIPTLYDHYPQNATFEDEEQRRNSILQSLDQQKRYQQQRLELLSPERPNQSLSSTSNANFYRPDAVYLQQSNAVTAPYIKAPSKKEPSPPEEEEVNQNEEEEIKIEPKATKRGKPHKELLTEEEKRANHIMSEQKRRSTIRNGFKDLTEIVPTLKNINNSKSTVLFKAVDYIKYLEKRNKGLREKIGALEMRVEVEGRMGNAMMMGRTHPYSSHPYHRPQTQIQAQAVQAAHQQHQHQHQHQQQQHSMHEKSFRSMERERGVGDNSLAASTAAALLAHKTQQKQLMALQEQLQIHQRFIAQQQDMKQKRLLKQEPDNHRWYTEEQQRERYTSASGNVPARTETKMEVEATDEPLKATVSA